MDHETAIVMVALFAAVPPTLAGLAAVIAALRAHRQMRDAVNNIGSDVHRLTEQAQKRIDLEEFLEEWANAHGVLPSAGPAARPDGGGPDTSADPGGT